MRTDVAGAYELADLAPAAHLVSAEWVGFRSETREVELPASASADE